VSTSHEWSALLAHIVVISAHIVAEERLAATTKKTDVVNKMFIWSQ
jgi:hypothetical protein